MSNHSRPLTREQVYKAHALIRENIHLTPVVTCNTLDELASTPQQPAALVGTEYEGQSPAHPRMRLFFKCENQQRIGAFKARGAFHALSRLTPAELERGVITHSSGNHAQALALAAKAQGVKAYIVMPSISTPSKIAGTQSLGAEVHFSGSTQPEREAVVKVIQERTGAVLVPPYDHADIVLGQGTAALEFEEQVKATLKGQRERELAYEGHGWRLRLDRRKAAEDVEAASEGLDAVVAPCGGGGLLSGTATALSGTGVSVFGAEPWYQGGNDCQRGLAMDPLTRVETVSTLTIADGVRTPVGKIPWSVISDKTKVKGVFSVSEEQIKSAMRLLFERAKVAIEPTAALPLAVVLYDEAFRRIVERESGPRGVWNVGLILSGGNTTMESISALFSDHSKVQGEREQGVVGMHGEKVVENIAG